MTTEVTFPVSTGTTLSVTCDDSYPNTGDDVVTCYSETHYSYSATPTCVKTVTTGTMS